MVRPKTKIERLESEMMREHAFLHNRMIMVDKVRDLSVLAGVDVLFLSFSPSGAPSLCLGQHSDLSGIITKFALKPHEEREKRKLENLQSLKTNCERKGHHIDVETLRNGWKTKRLEDLYEELRELQAKLSHLNHQKSLWENPKNISSMEQIREMKETLTKSINGLRERKDHLNRQQIYNTEAVAQEQLLPQLPNHGTIYQGSHEGINPSMIHGSVGCSTQPNMLTGSMGSKQVFNFQDSYQQPNYNMSSLENFNRGLDQVHPEGLSFNPMQQFEAIDPSNANHFNPMQQFEPTCQSYVNHFPHPNSEPSVNPTWQP